MLEIKPQGKIVERIVRAKTGEFVLATFYVVEANGELQVRLLSVKPVATSRITNHESRITSNTFCLKGECLKSPAVTAERHVYTDFVSPFFNKFEFFSSIKIRAPSH